MNIHLPAILMWTTGVLLVLTHCQLVFELQVGSVSDSAQDPRRQVFQPHSASQLGCLGAEVFRSFFAGKQTKMGWEANMESTGFSIQPLLLCSNSIIQWNYEVTIINIIDLWNITNYHHPILCFFTSNSPVNSVLGQRSKSAKSSPKHWRRLSTHTKACLQNQKTNW